MTKRLNHKICKGCGLSKPYRSFSPRTDGRYTGRWGLNSKCRKCMGEVMAVHNKKCYRENTLKKRKEIYQHVRDYLATHPCVDCGEDDPIVLEFDHVRGEKLFNLSEARRRNRNREQVNQEILKCEVRCANCHRKATHNRRLAT